MDRDLPAHPVAKLFPMMSDADLAALTEDIRLHGVKVPILIHGGQILDGRHRYKACRALGMVCPSTEWNGRDPWLEVQSRNLMRRHLAKDQIYAIRVLASARFPELMAPIVEARDQARLRKVQAKNSPRGTKALSGAQGPNRSADVVGALLGVSGSTIKRVDRLARLAPEFVSKVAAGEVSVKKALREVAARSTAACVVPKMVKASKRTTGFSVPAALHDLQDLLRGEWGTWPIRYRSAFLDGLRCVLHDLEEEHATSAVEEHPTGMIEAAG
jgi:hypothetical protein